MRVGFVSGIVVCLLGGFVLAGESDGVRYHQSDWSGGVTAGPVASWDSGFAAADNVSWRAVPGQLTLASTPLTAARKHRIAAGRVGAYGLELVDLNGDGNLDVLATTDSSAEVVVWVNDGGGESFTEHIVDSEFAGGTSVRAADIDGDGDLDLVGAAQNPGNKLVWWQNTGEMASWVRHTIAARVPIACNVFVADVDGDGDFDVLSTSWSGMYLAWWDNGGGEPVTWTRRVIANGFRGAHSAWAEDVDGDGDIDVVATAAELGRVVLFENDGADPVGWSNTVLTSDIEGARYAVIADVDDDGRPDVVATGFDGTVAWWRNSGGDAASWTEEVIATSCTGGHFLDVADINGDGSPDILATAWTASTVHWFDRSTGEWQEHVIDGEFAEAMTAVAGDLDGDGDLDVAATAHGPGEIVWWEATAFVAAGTLDGAVLDLKEGGMSVSGEWTIRVPENGTAELRVRTGDDPSALGDWGEPLTPPCDLGVAARYLQYRVEMGSVNGTASPILEDVTFFVREQNPSPENPGDHVVVVPAAAHVDGAEGTRWTTDLVLHNASQSDAEVNIFWLAQSKDNTAAPALNRTVEAGRSARLDDVVTTLVGPSGGAGAVMVGSDVSLMVSSRTFNSIPIGTYGQYIPGVAVEEGVEGTTAATLLQLSGTEAFRTNIGFVNLGSSRIRVDGTLWSKDGVVLKTLGADLPPFSMRQLNAVLQDGGPVEDAYAVVTSPTAGARFLTYASVVDRRSGDPTFVAPSEALSEVAVVPAAAHVWGLGETRWRSDLEILSCGTRQARYVVEMLPEGGGSAPRLTLDTHHAARYGDVVSSLLNGDGAGALRITVEQGEVMVTSRTYNDAPGGTYGQFIPALPLDGALTTGEEARLIQLSSSKKSGAAFRTNIGFANAGDKELRVDLRLFAGAGTEIGRQTVTIAPNSLNQVNQVFRALVDGEVMNGFAVLSSESPEARFFAYASVVDEQTGDPVFVPAMRPPR